jgi:hypothetical protein
VTADNLFFRSTCLSLVVVVALLGAACSRTKTGTTEPTGPTTREVIERYRQPYAQMRERLREIARQLPPKGSVKNSVGDAKGVTRLSLNPLPSYNRSGSDGTVTDNTGVLSEEQLLDTEATPEFDLLLIGFPQNCFYWLSQKYASAADLNRVDDGNLARGFEAGLARRYLLVYRTARYVRAEVSENNYTPGSLDLELFLFDFQSNRLLTSFRASAKTSSETRVPGNSNVQVWVEDTIRQNVRAVIADSIANLTGGSFDYRLPKK